MPQQQSHNEAAQQNAQRQKSKKGVGGLGGEFSRPPFQRAADIGCENTPPSRYSVRVEWAMICTAHNILKLYKATA